jgi:hypothetical protein
MTTTPKPRRYSEEEAHIIGDFLTDVTDNVDEQYLWDALRERCPHPLFEDGFLDDIERGERCVICGAPAPDCP